MRVIGMIYQSAREPSMLQPEAITLHEPHRWKTVDDVLVSFMIPGCMPDAVWDGFLAHIMAQRPRYCLLLCLGRVEVDAAQRRRTTHAVMRTRTAVVVLTDNRMTRDLAMAMAWFGAKLDAYAWAELEPAIGGLDVLASTRERLLHEAGRFHAALGHIDR